MPASTHQILMGFAYGHVIGQTPHQLGAVWLSVDGPTCTYTGTRRSQDVEMASLPDLLHALGEGHTPVPYYYSVERTFMTSEEAAKAMRTVIEPTV